MKIPLRLGLNKSSGPDGDYHHLTAEDADAGVQLLSVDLSHEQFAQLVTGTNLRAEGDVRIERVGMLFEHREIVVEAPGVVVYQRKETMHAAEQAVRLAALNLNDATHVEGATSWAGDVADLFNSHKWVSKAADGVHRARVGFHRHVPRKP